MASAQGDQTGHRQPRPVTVTNRRGHCGLCAHCARKPQGRATPSRPGGRHELQAVRQAEQGAGRLERGETPLGMQMYTHDPDLIEIVGYTGFDFVMIDMEHNRTNPETMVHLIRAAEVSGLTPLVRVGANDRFPHPLRGGIRRAGHRGAAREDRRRGQSGAWRPATTRLTATAASARPSAPRATLRATGRSTWRPRTSRSCSSPSLEDVEAIDNAEEIISVLKPGRDGVGVGGADITQLVAQGAGEKVQWAPSLPPARPARR